MTSEKMLVRARKERQETCFENESIVHRSYTTSPDIVKCSPFLPKLKALIIGENINCAVIILHRISDPGPYVVGNAGGPS
jgi:hypothetical protein